jgi:predicted RNA-binding Zn-ribbon protein involved in translation (DUF1610 family)
MKSAFVSSDVRSANVTALRYMRNRPRPDTPTRNVMRVLYARLFPELSLCGSIGSQRTALRRAVGWTYAVGCLLGPLVFFGAIVLRSSIPGFQKILNPWGIIALGVVSGLGGAGAVWCARRGIRRSLWRQLGERGIPICVCCGYDLRGQTSHCCPECGATIERLRPDRRGS